MTRWKLRISEKVVESSDNADMTAKEASQWESFFVSPRFFWLANENASLSHVAKRLKSFSIIDIIDNM